MIGDKARVAYYEGRLRLMSNSRAMLAVIAAMAQRGNDGLDIDTATKALDDASFDGASVVREAIEHGVLTRTPARNCPSAFRLSTLIWRIGCGRKRGESRVAN